MVDEVEDLLRLDYYVRNFVQCNMCGGFKKGLEYRGGRCIFLGDDRLRCGGRFRGVYELQ